MDPMEAIRQTFFQECEEQLAELETGLLAMQEGTSDSETVNAVFRAVHSVKGGAGAFGLDSLVRFAHVFETCLDEVRSDRLAPTPDVLKVLLRSADILSDLVRGARGGQDPAEDRVSAAAAELAAVTQGVAPAQAPVPLPAEPVPPALDDGFAGIVFQPVMVNVSDESTWRVCFRPHAALYAKANDALLLLRELGFLGTVQTTLDASALPDLDSLDPEGAYLSWTVEVRTAQPESAIREVFEFVDSECDVEVSEIRTELPVAEPVIESQPVAILEPLHVASEPSPAVAAAVAAREETAVSAKTTIRVDLDRVDRLIDLVGELVINGAMLTQRCAEAGLGRSSAVSVGLSELENLTREIQDSVMAIRAQPVKSVFARMPRLVREVAALTGKQVRLVSDGENTEVDKTVIEHLSDPLTHMIRNAIDHGLERPEERRRVGKPEQGTVRLAASHRSGRIVIEVADDGAGINRDRVRASAVAKGLVPGDATLTDEEIDNLIFLPGFSTAATVSDISGRGVGMDVVRRSIQGLGGRIAIASRPGQGSTFTLSLPLTLAVLDGMVVTVSEQTLVVPLTAIIETLQPRASNIHEVGDGGRVLNIRGTYVPLLSVGAMLGWEPAGAEGGSVAILVEADGGTRAALLVDAIQGQQQVVIKSLEANYRQVQGVAAATILGDGRVALILDVDGMVNGPRCEGTFVETQPTVGMAYA
jgi:two-component system chemotaxis sensor kinase CheA